jgi:hypothetical protein
MWLAEKLDWKGLKQSHIFQWSITVPCSRTLKYMAHFFLPHKCTYAMFLLIVGYWNSIGISTIAIICIPPWTSLDMQVGTLTAWWSHSLIFSLLGRKEVKNRQDFVIGQHIFMEMSAENDVFYLVCCLIVICVRFYLLYCAMHWLSYTTVMICTL